MDFPNNPIDTPEQRRHELLALELFESPELTQVRAEVRDFWLDLVKPSDDQRSCFDAAFEEVMFGAVIWALNQDPLYPEVITISRVPHGLAGRRVPGSRWGIDNPDSIYRVIPISGKERYEITGRVYSTRMVENYFTLWDPDMRTVGLLNGKDLEVDAQGRFTISVDSDPANGRANHIQTCPEAHEFYIRDVIADWAGHRANELSVRRLGDEPARGPETRDQQIERCAQYMRKWAENTTRWNNQALHKPANDFSFTIDRDTDGALRNQIYIMGHFALENDDQVLVLDIAMGGAEYFIAPITNVWGTTNDIVQRNGCLNMSQSLPNPDGTYTFALSVSDPGVHNWLDPTDMRDGLLTLRWAEFPDDQPLDSLGVICRLMDRDSFLAAQPESMRCSAGQRQQQLQTRADSYAWRIAENS